MDVEVWARIPLIYLPTNWKKIIEKTIEAVVEEEVCRLFANDFMVDNGLVLRLRIGNGCLDDILSQIHEAAKVLGAEPIIRWRYL